LTIREAFDQAFSKNKKRCKFTGREYMNLKQSSAQFEEYIMLQGREAV
jgi:hypothetical protein